jgi:transposase
MKGAISWLMDRVNKYCHRSHISERNFRQIIRYFAMDLEATKIAELTGVSRVSKNSEADLFSQY